MAVSPAANLLVADLLAIPPAARRPFYKELSAKDWRALVTASRKQLGSPYAMFQDDPCGFVEIVIGDTTWSRQRAVFDALAINERVAVPSTHSASKTFSAARASAWWGAVWPISTAQVITLAPTFRQVKNLMWPEIRQAVKAGHLPGVVQQSQWKLGEELIGYGMSPPDYDEASLQGIHKPNLLIVVDEAGGISHTVGNALVALLSNPNARLLMIGNPPTDDEGTWFEEQCEKSALVETIRISAMDTPNFTGEPTGRCTTCDPAVPAHRVALHLTPVEWVEEVTSEFGEDSAFVIARVHAQFPRGMGRKVIPYGWVEAAAALHATPAAGTWVRIGADIASDGGDEFCIARAEGFAVELVHRSSGAANVDPVVVAGVITQATREACERRDRLGDEQLVHVKIDASGLGWGVAGLVKRQVEEANLPARVFPVRGEDKPHDETQFRNARSELWWNMRRLMRPNDDDEAGKVKLVNAPTRLVAQLQAPNYTSDAAGRIVIEKKRDMKARGVGSPDLADAVNLAFYEPAGGGPATVERAPQTRIPLRPTDIASGQGATVIPLGPSQRR